MTSCLFILQHEQMEMEKSVSTFSLCLHIKIIKSNTYMTQITLKIIFNAQWGYLIVYRRMYCNFFKAHWEHSLANKYITFQEQNDEFEESLNI